jgi:hypothetical protein
MTQKSVRLGGEFRNVAGADLSAHAGRVKFLGTIAELAPEVRGSLRDKVGPYYITALRETRPLRVRRWQARQAEWELWRWERGEWDFDADEVPGTVSRLRDRALEWGGKWHLHDPWILDAAFRTLRALEHCPTFDEYMPPYFMDLRDPSSHKPRDLTELLEQNAGELFEGRLVGAERPLSFQHPEWYPFWKSRTAYEEQARKAFDEALRRHLDAREESAEQAGFMRSPEKRGQFEAQALQHFEWLVRYQLQGRSRAEIADEYNRARTSVSDALRNTANLIGLALRQ